MGTEERHHQRAAEMNLKATLVTPLMLCLVTGAPSPYNEAQAAPQTKSVSCRTEYSVVWDTQYQEKETQECVTDYEKVCHTVTERLCKPTTRQECQTIYEKSCSTVYKSVCVDQYKTEYEPYTETECTTQYKEDCEYQWEGYGNNKVWAPIPGTCKQNPYDSCKDVTKTKERQVAYPVCKEVPRQHCTNNHKKVPVRVSKSVPKKVCDTGYSAHPSHPLPEGPAVLDIGRTPDLVKSNKIVFADK